MIDTRVTRVRPVCRIPRLNLRVFIEISSTVDAYWIVFLHQGIVRYILYVVALDGLYTVVAGFPPFRRLTENNEAISTPTKVDHQEPRQSSRCSRPLGSVPSFRHTDTDDYPPMRLASNYQRTSTMASGEQPAVIRIHSLLPRVKYHL